MWKRVYSPYVKSTTNLLSDVVVALGRCSCRSFRRSRGRSSTRLMRTAACRRYSDYTLLTSEVDSSGSDCILATYTTTRYCTRISRNTDKDWLEIYEQFAALDTYPAPNVDEHATELRESA